MATLLPNEPTVGCSEAKLQCAWCDVRIQAAWRDEENMSPSAAKLFEDFRREHSAHPEYAEALPVIGRQVLVDNAPPRGSTVYDRWRMTPAPHDNAPPPSPPLTAPPAPSAEEDGGGESPRQSHYPGL